MQLQVNEPHPGNTEMRARVSIRMGVFFAIFLLPILAFAQNDDWLGGAGNWSNGSMWSLGAPPSSSNNALIDNGNAKASAVTLDVNGQCSNLTIDSDDSLNFNSFLSLTVYGGTISNAGAITINGSNATNSVLNLAANTSLQGGGTVTLTYNNGTAIIQGSGFTLTNTNNTIQGLGIIGNGSMALSNAGTVNANVAPGPNLGLFLNGTGGITNTNLLEATNGGLLEIENTVNNSGGNITSNGSSSLVELANADIQGGTLNTLNSGNLEAAELGCSNSVTLDGSTHGALTLSTGSTYTDPDQITNLLGTINNKGNFQVNGFNACSSTLNLTANTSLQGGGTVTLNTNGGNAIIQGSGFTLTNTNNTIRGLGIVGNGGSMALINAGTVNANQAPPPNGGLFLNGTGGITNTNLLEATNGGLLEIENTVNNSGGNITSNGSSSLVELANADIQGGTLNSLNSGTLEAAELGCSNSVTLDGSTHGALTLSTGSTFIDPDQTTNLLGTINNNGSFQIISSNGCFSTLNLAGNTTLQGKGTVTLNISGGAFLQGSGFTLTNTSNTILGAGVIGNGTLSFVNGSAGTIYANISGQALLLNASGTITNNGTFKVGKGSALHVTNGMFTNFSGSTLTGGTYNTANTLQIDELGSGGGEISTNSAKIILTGANATIVDQLSNNALTNFASNTKKGSFSLMSGNSLTTSGSITNAGLLTVGAKSTLKPGSGSYTQTSGTTTVDGTLNAPAGVDIQAGSLFGKGIISGTVVSSGSVTAGDSTKKAGKLSMSTYTQNSGGSLNIQIGGTTLGTQYSQLAVSNGVSLSGTLNIKLINNFVPAIGNTFTILTGSAISGKFSTVNGQIINSGECFQVTYGGTSVTLKVESGTGCTNG